MGIRKIWSLRDLLRDSTYYIILRYIWPLLMTYSHIWKDYSGWEVLIWQQRDWACSILQYQIRQNVMGQINMWKTKDLHPVTIRVVEHEQLHLHNQIQSRIPRSWRKNRWTQVQVTALGKGSWRVYSYQEIETLTINTQKTQDKKSDPKISNRDFQGISSFKNF